MPISQSRMVLISLLGPPILWSFHFLFVYVFVSLACLWTWEDISFLGLGVIEGVVVLATLGVAAAIAMVGLLGWRQRGDAPCLVFLAQITVMMSAMFLFGTLFVGLPTLPAATCF